MKFEERGDVLFINYISIEVGHRTFIFLRVRRVQSR